MGSVSYTHLATIGYGGLQMARVLPKLKDEYNRLKASEPKPITVDVKKVHSTAGVVVEGIDNCPIKFAKCCSPLPGDEIIGFVTRGFGVSIHKKDCGNVRESMKSPENAGRWVRAYWADNVREDYKATLELVCMDRANPVSYTHLDVYKRQIPCSHRTGSGRHCKKPSQTEKFPVRWSLRTGRPFT